MINKMTGMHAYIVGAIAVMLSTVLFTGFSFLPVLVAGTIYTLLFMVVAVIAEHIRQRELQKCYTEIRKDISMAKKQVNDLR